MSRVSSVDAVPSAVAGGGGSVESARATVTVPAAESVAGPGTGRATSVRRKVLLGLGLLASLAGGGYWYAERDIESTDNAQVDADVVAVPARVSGQIAFVYFTENQAVAAGTVLAQLDPAPFQARLAEAEATLAAAQASAEAANAEAELVRSEAVGNRDIARANLQTSSTGVRASSDSIREGEAQVATARAKLAQTELDLTRAQQLFDSGAFTRSQLDAALTARQLASSALAAESARLSGLRLAQSQSQSRVVEASAKLRVSDQVPTLVRQAEARAAVARAQVETAEAARDLAALDLSYTKITAPSDGVVSKKSINAGQTVAAGQSIVQLVPKQRWVTANFKETQLAHMKAGQPVRFTLDAYPDVELTGDVQSFSGATGARFTLLPPDNASGNFTKVVQRVPVRVRVHEVPKDVELRPGMSVELRVDTNHG
ncbi:MAG: hemolysin [Myxococcaceae bacterium]|nr:hemolysin [Myxococcaceae bacterium]